ncbi:hypothetical protein BC828DRAFT_432897, partial [Blastocladiella britannica]
LRDPRTNACCHDSPHSFPHTKDFLSYSSSQFQCPLISRYRHRYRYPGTDTDTPNADHVPLNVLAPVPRRPMATLSLSGDGAPVWGPKSRQRSVGPRRKSPSKSPQQPRARSMRSSPTDAPIPGVDSDDSPLSDLSDSDASDDNNHDVNGSDSDQPLAETHTPPPPVDELDVNAFFKPVTTYTTDSSDDDDLPDCTPFILNQLITPS